MALLATKLCAISIYFQNDDLRQTSAQTHSIVTHENFSARISAQKMQTAGDEFWNDAGHYGAFGISVILISTHLYEEPESALAHF